MSVKGTHSFTRQVEALSSSARAQLGSSVVPPAQGKGKDRRQVHHLSGFRPHVSPGTLVTFLR